jgi:hypothetical protein
MEDSSPALANGAPNATRHPPKRKPREISILFLPIFLPLFFVAGALSIPWTYVQKLKQRRQEKRFATEMASSGRIMTWSEFESAVGNGEGTAIGEYLSLKGPFRLWWTPEDIPATSPHNCNQQNIAWPQPEFADFFNWCRAQFTSPQLGRAKLVLIPDGERAKLQNKLDSARYVSIYSSPMDRKKRKSTTD